MQAIQNNIVLITALLLFLGWWVHNWTVLARLTRIKGRRIGLKWFILNRPYKLKISAVSSLVSGLIAFIWFDPQSLDLAVKSDKQSLAIYLSAIFGIGVGADFVVDQVGTKAKVARHSHDYDEPDDGKSLFVSEEERARILEEAKNGEDNKND